MPSFPGGVGVRRQLTVGVLLALVGFAAVTQVRANDHEHSYTGLRQQDLIDLLSALAVTRQQTEDEIERLEAVRQDLQSDTSQRRAALAEAQKQIDDLSILAGLVPVTGPGVRITITEVTGTVDLASFLDTVQELKIAGAEAIQINGTVRVTATTSFTEIDGGFLIDGTTVSAPYVIDAIGPPDTLVGAIDFRYGPREQLEEDGAELAVDELTALDIESVADPAASDFAVPE